MHDRSYGAVIASAVGDALGSRYEFGPPIPANVAITFGRGYFGTGVGEWTDDTSMAIPILQELAAGADLTGSAPLARIVAAWREWSKTAPDVGIQTRRVLSQLEPPFNEDAARAAALAVHEQSGRSAGNGSLMRTGPVALGFLGDGTEPKLVDAAARIAELTHWGHDSSDACVIWSLAIRHAIRTGTLAIYDQLKWLPEQRQQRWRRFIDEALKPGVEPVDFHKSNGWVVSAFQAALAAIQATTTLPDALEIAVRGGHDTDTVAAITGSLAGAIYGASNLPQEWRDQIYGWPGLRETDLINLVDAAVATRTGQA